MSAAHTPGPWRVTKHSAAPNGLDIMCGSIRVAAVSAANGNAEQSARLIAAAPQLAEALRLVLSMHCRATEPHRMYEDRVGAMDAARAALTAAGVTP